VALKLRINHFGTAHPIQGVRVKKKLIIECPQLDVIIDLLTLGIKQIVKKEKQIMATLDAVKEQVLSLNTKLDGWRAAMELIKAELEALKDGEALPPKAQAKVDNISALIEETQLENFPVEPPPPVPPDTV
jgi:cell division protein FtsB